MSIVYSPIPCPRCGARCQVWVRDNLVTNKHFEFRVCGHCGWRETDDNVADLIEAARSGK